MSTQLKKIIYYLPAMIYYFSHIYFMPFHVNTQCIETTIIDIYLSQRLYFMRNRKWPAVLATMIQ